MNFKVQKIEENFLELLRFLANRNEENKCVIFNNAPTNLQMTSPSIHKQIVSVCSAETSKAFIQEIGELLFSVMIDDSLAVVLVFHFYVTLIIT